MSSQIDQKGNAILLILASMASLTYVYMNLTASLKEATKAINQHMTKVQRERVIKNITTNLSHPKSCFETFQEARVTGHLENVVIKDLTGEAILAKKFSSFETTKLDVLQVSFHDNAKSKNQKSSFPTLRIKWKLRALNQVRIEEIPILAKWDSKGKLDHCAAFDKAPYLAFKNSFCEDKNCRFKTLTFKENPNACAFSNQLYFNGRNAAFCF
jgi:hypothetical protein